MNEVFGTWRLLSLKFQLSDSPDSVDMYGADPLGQLILTPDFRMMTLVTARGREAAEEVPAEAALFRSMMAYSGPFRLEGADKFITRVEVSWHPGWLGTEQARTYVIAGDVLSISTAETSHPMFPGRRGLGILKWARV